MLVAKKHTSTTDNVLAVCDEDIVGKVFEEGEIVLNLDPDFYGNTACSEEEIKEMFNQCSVLNLCGEKTIKFFNEKLGLSFENVIRIKGIPHVQSVYC